MKTFAHKNIVITGGASGIGRLMALRFAAEDANLAILDINKIKLQETERELQSFGSGVHSFQCDMSDRKDIEKTAGVIKKAFAAIDILVNNAGIVVGKSIVDSSYEDFRKTIDINLMGVMWMTRQFLPEMMKLNSGHIVNISSAAGLLAVPRLADYCATKFAVVGFSDSLRMEMKKYGHRQVTVTCVCPSVFDTGMFDGFKAPILNPLLKPDYVADNIIKAIRKKKAYLKLPFMVKLIPLFKIFPACAVDWMAEVLGVSGAMDSFRGH